MPGHLPNFAAVGVLVQALGRDHGLISQELVENGLDVGPWAVAQNLHDPDYLMIGLALPEGAADKRQTASEAEAALNQLLASLAGADSPLPSSNSASPAHKPCSRCNATCASLKAWHWRSASSWH